MDHQDEALRRAVAEGRRAEFASFGWRPEDIPDPGAEETYLSSKLSWDELDREPHRSVLSWYRSLITLRRSTPELQDGALRGLRVEYDEDRQLLVVQRGRIVVACNISGEPLTLDLPEGGGTLLLASRPDADLHGRTLFLPAEVTAVASL
jgi:maltooligosyltrehalose trehalohydrolase